MLGGLRLADASRVVALAIGADWTKVPVRLVGWATPTHDFAVARSQALATAVRRVVGDT